MDLKSNRLLENILNTTFQDTSVNSATTVSASEIHKVTMLKLLRVQN
jgi:hypothetical protein